MRKPIQITENKLVICDDGSMWGWHWPMEVEFPKWERLPDIPQDDEVKDEKETSKEEVQWQKIETCPRDGSFILEINDSFNKIKPLLNPPQQGWECPKCGSVYAPFMPVCTKCGKENK